MEAKVRRILALVPSVASGSMVKARPPDRAVPLLQGKELSFDCAARGPRRVAGSKIGRGYLRSTPNLERVTRGFESFGANTRFGTADQQPRVCVRVGLSTVGS